MLISASNVACMCLMVSVCVVILLPHFCLCLRVVVSKRIHI